MEWFHTGDIGELDAEGYLRITDRKKDMFKTSGESMWRPRQLRPVQRAYCPVASDLIMYGESKPFCVALVSLDTDAVTEWAARNGPGDKSFAEIARDDGRGIRRWLHRY